MTRRIVLGGVLCCLVWSASCGVDAADRGPSFAPLDPEATLTPQTLLSLIHTPEVHRELKISDSAFAAFQPTLREIDGPWWRVRIRGGAEQRAVTARQETLLVEAIRQRFGVDALRRLRQIELQAQGYRCLVRPEVKDFLKLSSSQVAELTRVFTETDALAAKANPRPGKEDADAKVAWQQARLKESETARESLSTDQRRRLNQLVGDVFDTSKLTRVYPLAPELVDSDTWVGRKVKLGDLKGRVVLLHFYAFQCHNCHANFPIYNRWQKELTSQGVSIIGIQTPETANERDFSSVASAAQRAGFEFPVLVDLKSENWDAWSNTMWPTVYVIDKRGFIRMWWQGELKWQGATADDRIEQLVEKLLQEP